MIVSSLIRTLCAMPALVARGVPRALFQRWAAGCGVVLLTLLSAGCATDAGVRITSEPSGARVFVDDRFMGLTPVAVEMDPARGHVVRLERNGFGDYLWEYDGRGNPAAYHAKLTEVVSPKKRTASLPEYGPKDEEHRASMEERRKQQAEAEEANAPVPPVDPAHEEGREY